MTAFPGTGDTVSYTYDANGYVNTITNQGRLSEVIGSTSPNHLLEPESVQEDFEERAAIMEFDDGRFRDEAEREAWALVSKHYRLH